MEVEEDAVSSDASPPEFPMPTQPAPQPPAPEPPGTPAPSAADRPPPDPNAANPETTEEGTLFHALLDAGAEAKVAYTAEKRLYAMISETIAPQLQPLVAEVCRRFDERFDRIERRLDEHDHRLDALAAAGVERDRKLDVLITQMRMLLGGLGVLVTVLIAVFGILFTR